MHLCRYVLGPALGLWVVLAPAEESEMRQHEAHEHGSARLNVAIEGAELYAEFASPAANIVGFEYRARTAEEKKTVHEALEMLEHGSRLLRPTAAARCRLSEVEVDSEMLEGGHGHQQHDEEEHGEMHSEFHVSYRFACGAPEALDSIEVKLFELFPGMERIESQVITDRGQTRAQLTPKRPNLAL